MSDVLIDSSSWIDFLKGKPEAVKRVDPLIAEDRAAISGVVFAEVLSGAKDRAVFQHLRTNLLSLGWLTEPADLWDRTAEARYTLARAGFQAALTDLMIAVTALEAGHSILTRDGDFARIRSAVPVEIVLF